MELLRNQRNYMSTEQPSGDLADVTNIYTEYEYHVKERDAFLQNAAIVKIVFSVLLSITGVALLLFILAKKELRNQPTFWLVINILVAVIFEGLVLLPMYLMHDNFPAGIVGCHITFVFPNFQMLHTQTALMLLFVDRFIYFFKPERHAYHMSPCTVRVLICCFVFVELALIILTTFTLIKPALVLHHKSLVCSPKGHWEMRQINDFMLHVLPMLLNVFFGVIVLVFVLTGCCKARKNSNNSNGKQAVSLILLLVFFDVICNTSWMLNYLSLPHLDYSFYIFIHV